MFAQLILFACCGFILWLFRNDLWWRKVGSRALLIPGAWLAIQGSRPLSYWFGESAVESQPINVLSFAAFLVVSILVLSHRRMNWGDLIRQNKALFLIYGYLLCSILWSEMPFASLKRLSKDFGAVLVGLIFLSQLGTVAAIKAVYVRVSYLLFPLSLVFIKYFPEIGRNTSRAGDNMFTGVTTQKNSLGETVFVFSIMILWDLVEIYKDKERRGRKLQIATRLGLLLIGLWLLVKCDSKTSLFCLVIGALMFWGCGKLVRMANGKRVLIGSLVALVCVVGFDKTFGISEIIIRAMGRDTSLTGRTDIWRLVLEQRTDPIIGHGFYTFWDGPKGMAVGEAFMRINTSHNGYLEMYLDGGILGCALLGILLLAIGRRVIERLFNGHPLGRVGVTFWLLAILYNFAESSFFRLDVLWFTLLLLVVECPQLRRVRVNARVAVRNDEPMAHGNARYSH